MLDNSDILINGAIDIANALASNEKLEELSLRTIALLRL
jgi:hypothetical protein